MDLKKVEVLNENGTAEIILDVTRFDKKPTFSDDYFSLNKNLEVSKTDEEVKLVTKIEEAIFPMFVPENTSLTAQNIISKDMGERVILTFSGEKPFVLVEETVSKSEDFEVIPTIGEPTLLMDSIGSLSEDSVSWIKDGIEYYIASNDLTKEEMLSVAKSISTIPVMK